MENRNAKSLLAKLMAAEDINVEYSESASTAAFDTEGRTLIMPLLKDVSAMATDLFLGHEVGHALYTPQGRIKDILAEGGMFKQFVNITEDARIEKMIQNKFPGLRRCFFDGYTELMDKDFFGTVGTDVNSYNLIDRLNLHFKVGLRAGVEFSADEQVYADRMDNLKTFDDAVELARDLYDHCKEESENNNPDESETEETTDGGEGDTGDTGEMSSDNPMDFDDADSSDDNGESSSGSSGEESEENENSEEKAEGGTSDTADEKEENESTGKNKTSPGEGATDDMVSSSPEDFGPVTQDSFDKSVKDIIDSDHEISYGRIPTLPIKEMIIPIETIHEHVDKARMDWGGIGHDGDGMVEATSEYKKFSTEQKSLISYLVKEFEMKKSAAEHKRTSVGTTGVLNPNKLHAYKFSDDIFLRNTIVADGKSHGFIMYLDWSGSMSHCMSKTIDQLMLLALFCKKANIPFDCFAFSNYYGSLDDPERQSRRSKSYYEGKEKELAVTTNIKLLHLISSQLNNQKFTKAMVYMTYLRQAFNYRSGYGDRYDTSSCHLPDGLMLGGTPLNEAVMSAFEIVPMFRKKYNVDIVNTVFLTDGAGASLRAIHRTPTEDNGNTVDRIGSNAHITDMVTKKTYKLDRYGEDTGLMLEILRDRTDCRVTGFFINTERKNNLMQNLRMVKNGLTFEESAELWDNIKKEGFGRLECKGYQEFYVIDGKKMNGGVEELQITDDMSKAKMRSAFIKNRKGKFLSKKMLSQFAEFVS